MGDVWKWGAEVGGNCWRTTGDINDTWGSMSGIGFSQDGHEKYRRPRPLERPGHAGRRQGRLGPNLHPTQLTPNEQITHISLWSLLAAPLLIGCDLTQLDPFTLSLLTNDEVLDVDQDPLGRPAGRRSQHGQTEVWARPLLDGTMAVGLFNRGPERPTVTGGPTSGCTGSQPVRDLWRQKDLGAAGTPPSRRVPAHGAVLVKIGRPKQPV